MDLLVQSIDYHCYGSKITILHGLKDAQNIYNKVKIGSPIHGSYNRKIAHFVCSHFAIPPLNGIQ